MNRCKDCKWWDLSRGDEGNDGHPCSSPLVGKDMRPTLFGLDLCYGDELEGEIGFWTGPDFGCVNFEDKESKT